MATPNQIAALKLLVEKLFCMDSVKLDEFTTLSYFDADELDAVEFILSIEEEFRVSLQKYDNFSLDELNKIPLFEFLKNDEK